MSEKDFEEVFNGFKSIFKRISGRDLSLSELDENVLRPAINIVLRAKRPYEEEVGALAKEVAKLTGINYDVAERIAKEFIDKYKG